MPPLASSAAVPTRRCLHMPFGRFTCRRCLRPPTSRCQPLLHLLGLSDWPDRPHIFRTTHSQHMRTVICSAGNATATTITECSVTPLIISRRCSLTSSLCAIITVVFAKRRACLFACKCHGMQRSAAIDPGSLHDYATAGKHASRGAAFTLKKKTSAPLASLHFLQVRYAIGGAPLRSLSPSSTSTQHRLRAFPARWSRSSRAPRRDATRRVSHFRAERTSMDVRFDNGARGLA